MSDGQQTNDMRNRTENKPARKSGWKTFLKIFGFTFCGLIVLLLTVITVGVSYLSPKRLTPIIEKIANENLDADVSIGSARLSFWHTFPRLIVEIDSLNIRSKAFDKLPDAERKALPVYADSLLSMRGLRGALSIPALLKGDIALDYVTLESPRFNFVQATQGVTSLDIFPGNNKTKNDKSSGKLPDISVGRFEIKDGFPIRYTSIPDSIDASVTLTTTEVDGEGNPRYMLDVKGLTSASIDDLHLTDLAVGLAGEVKWSPSEPAKVELEDFRVAVSDVALNVSTKADFTDAPVIESLKVILPPTAARSIVGLIPTDMQGELAKVDARFNVALAAELTSPFRLGVDSIPSALVSIEIPEGQANYDGMHLSTIALNAQAAVDGGDPDRSVITVNRLKAIGEGIGFEVNGTITSPLSDPRVKGKFKGGLRAQRLPKSLYDNLPLTARGDLKADFDFDLRKSFLKKENFHRIKLSGDATLKELEVAMAAMGVDVKAREVALKLGTSSKFVTGAGTVDSLLTASLTLDTIDCELPGMSLKGARIKAGVGMKNVSTSSDTTLINPIGARLVADRVIFSTSAEDSMHLRLRNATIGASVRRYKGDARQPQMTLHVSTERAFYGDNSVKAIAGKALLHTTIHPKAQRVRPKNDIDSAVRAARRAARRQTDSIARANGQVLDMGVDGSLAALMRKWNAAGTLRADRLGLYTHAFPLRTRLSSLRMDFTSDSITMHDTDLRLGRSNFNVNGTISNLTRALTSRSGRQQLKARLTLDADTIDVNQLTEAIFAGAAYAETHSLPVGPMPADETENEAALEASVTSGKTDSMAVFVVPSNIDAELKVTARDIAYSNLDFRNFKGTVTVLNGAIRLSDLKASSDVGSIGLTALYSAPVRTDASFAFGLNVQDFRLAQFMNLVPAVDSIMPLLNGISGRINARMAATTDIDSAMNIDLPTLRAALNIRGDSLVLIDEDVYNKIGKWLMFKDRKHNVIDSMSVEMVVENSTLRLFPFKFNLDRYKLGVMGTNDMALNLNYHIAVLKSPIPFKFGINIKGTPDKMKISLGKARFNEKNMPAAYQIADTTRINLVREIANIFRRGVEGSKVGPLRLTPSAPMPEIPAAADTLSSADSLYFKQQGLQF